jgi:hypothetical protein
MRKATAAIAFSIGLCSSACASLVNSGLADEDPIPRFSTPELMADGLVITDPVHLLEQKISRYSRMINVINNSTNADNKSAPRIKGKVFLDLYTALLKTTERELDYIKKR